MTTPPVRFETLIERHHDEIYRYLWHLLKNAGWTNHAVEAQDLTQEVFLRAYRTFERLRQNSNHRAWLYKIATNCAYTAMKQDQRRTPLDVPLLDKADQIPSGADASPDRQVILGQELAVVREAILALPLKQRMAVVLRHVQGLDYPAIAQALDCSEDSARANVYQGLRRLRRVLKDGEKE